MPMRNGREYAYSVGKPDGGREYYDADGNFLWKDSEDPNPQSNAEVRSGATANGTGREVAGDPVTGREYSYDVTGGDKKDRRKQEQAQRAHRTNYFGANANEAIQGIDDPWLDLQGAIPGVDDLAGPALDSELGGAQADAQSVAAQRAALQQLEQISRGGMTAQERAAMQQSRSNAANYEKQQRDAILQQAALRGMQGAGTTLGAQLAAQQGGANRVSQDAMNQQAMAQQRALQAMQMRGQLGGQMRGQSFSEDATRRSAVDDFARWNHQNRTGAHRDRWGMQATTAQGTSQARNAQAEQNRAMMENAQGQKTTTEKRADQAQGLIGSVI